MNENISSIVNKYSFIRTALDRNDPIFIKNRLTENSIIKKQRIAVSLCKKLTGVNSLNLSKLTNDDKSSIEQCLRDNFLSKDPNYFGKRDYIYLDLFDMN